MAEYYPLLARAVSAQPNATDEMRAGIYDRARKALLGQLRAHVPPIADEDIEREAQALEDAISRIESERLSPSARPAPSAPSGAAPATTSSRPPPTRPMSFAERAEAYRAAKSPQDPKNLQEPKSAPEPKSPPEPKSAPEPAGAGRFQKPPPLSSQQPQPAAVQQAPAQPVSAQHAAAQQAAAQPATLPPPVLGPTNVVGALEADSRPTDLRAERHGPGPDGSHASAPAIPGEHKQRLIRENGALPRSGMLWKFGRARAADESQAAQDAANRSPGDERGGENLVRANGRDDRRQGSARAAPSRPLAPLARRERRNPTLIWAVASGLAIFIAGVAILAFTLRDSPQTATNADKPAPVADAKPPNKIVDRIGVGPTGSPNAGAPSSSAANMSTLGSAATQPAVGSAGGAPAGSSPAAAPADQGVAVAQRAALLVQDQSGGDGQASNDGPPIMTYEGTVVWRLDTVSPGPNLPPTLAVRADVDVPDAKFKASFLFEKNGDQNLPASHTIELRFTPAADSSVGPVQQIDMPQMRKEESAGGDPLSGIPAQITANYFLVGLTKGDPQENNNLRLIRSAGWIDVPMLLANKRIAKITFEKGVAGQKALNDALTSWGN